MPPDTLNAAVIGCGRMGCSFDDSKSLRGFTYSHASTYSENPSINLIALYDINQDISRHYARKYNCTSHKTLEELLKTNIDIVSICTPPDHRLDIISQCVEAGVKFIFCEKPLALTAKEGEEILNLCKSNGVGLLCNHLRRFSPFYLNLSKFLKLDTVETSISCCYGGGIFNTGTHLLDTLNIFSGSPLEIAHAHSFYEISSTDFNVDFSLDFFSHVSCHIQATKAPVLEIKFTQATLQLILNLTYPFNSNPLCRFYSTQDNPIFPGSKELSPQDIPSALQYTAPNHHYFMKNAAHFIVEYLSTTFDKPDLSAYSGIEALKAINTLCQLKN